MHHNLSPNPQSSSKKLINHSNSVNLLHQQVKFKNPGKQTRTYYAHKKPNAKSDIENSESAICNSKPTLQFDSQKNHNFKKIETKSHIKSEAKFKQDQFWQRPTVTHTIDWKQINNLNFKNEQHNFETSSSEPYSPISPFTSKHSTQTTWNNIKLVQVETESNHSFKQISEAYRKNPNIWTDGEDSPIRMNINALKIDEGQKNKYLLLPPPDINNRKKSEELLQTKLQYLLNCQKTKVSIKETLDQSKKKNHQKYTKLNNQSTKLQSKSKSPQDNSLIPENQSIKHLTNPNLNIGFTTKKSGKKNKIFETTKLQDFDILKELGNGRFGQVLLAKHKLTGFLIALKKMDKQKIRELDMEKQIIQQIKLQSFLAHPNIAQLYGYFSDTAHLYLIMQYLPDGTLFDKLQKNKRLSEKIISGVLKQLSLALRYMHQFKIAHRDIKPENIVMFQSVAKLCDFGWAARVFQPRKTYCGTFDYAAPEVLQRKVYDERVDVWCLGILVYELLTGKVPFEHKERKLAIQKIINSDKQKLVFPIETSQKCKSIIENLLKKNPEQRITLNKLLQDQFFKI